MIFIHLFALSGVCFLGICFFGMQYASPSDRPQLRHGAFYLLLSLAFLARLAPAALSQGFGNDTACFASWAERICDTGPAGFYAADVFTDYPPGYLYLLWPVGFLRRLLNIEYYSAGHQLLLKLPSILSDLICAWLLYRNALKRFPSWKACFLCAAYLFNPAVFLNSSVWGQVDSLLTLCALILCLSLIQDRLYSAYIAFGAGFLIKPQMLFLGPVLLLATLDWILLEKDLLPRRLLRCLFQCLTVALGVLVLCLPFGLSAVVGQLFSTINSYPYAAVNACNLWGLFGLNWVSQDTRFLGIPYYVIGMTAVLAITALVLFLGRKLQNRAQKYPFLAAFTIFYIFFLSVRMHERYLYPALALFLLSYFYRPLKLTYLCYTAVSVLHFYNAADVLYFYDPSSYDRRALSILLPSFGMLLCGVLLGYLTYQYYRGEPGGAADIALSSDWKFPTDLLRGTPPARSREAVPLTKPDIFWLLAITLLYSCFALYDLGDRSAPVTTYDMTQNQSIALDFGGKAPAALSYYIAPWHGRTFALEGKWEEAAEWSPLSDLSLANVFTWQKSSLEPSAPYLRLTLRDTQASLLELVFTDEAGEILTPVNAGEYPALFDESALYPGDSSFRNSMYFDEIYHGRTAYEFLHGLYSYENTHPPLGKILISIGVALFGMNPFGWRIVGTLFGIAMVPIFYLFAKKLTGRTALSALACALFAFDFMHFAQTRIATIDVYITFFVLLMYYFLYQYSTVSFYDTPLQRTWLPLGACGVCMGLGIAAKWTGIYAGAGLAVIFFAVLYRRYREYLYAKANPKGESGGISHAYVVRVFRENALRTVCFCLVFFVAIPALIYLLSYLPFRDYENRGLLGRLWYNQSSMFSYHSNLEATHDFSSSWYEWPLILRPIWYYSRIVTQTAEGGLREGISSFGNPAVWWMGIPAFFYILYLCAAKRDKTAAFLTVGYLAQYLPWFFVTRITFIYHYFPSVPFVVLAIVHALSRCEEKGTKRRVPVLAALYGAAAFALFLLFYPVLSGQPVEAAFVARYLRWFKSWVLVAR